MDQPPRVFTLEEANQLVPTLEFEFGRVARLRAELGPLLEALGGADVAMAMLDRLAAPPAGREAEARRLRRVADGITGAVDRVNDLGCLIKDLDMGLVDFHSLREGEPVFLCWQFGEPSISHWHGIEEGFSERRSLEGVEAPAPEFMN